MSKKRRDVPPEVKAQLRLTLHLTRRYGPKMLMPQSGQAKGTKYHRPLSHMITVPMGKEWMEDTEGRLLICQN